MSVVPISFQLAHSAAVPIAIEPIADMTVSLTYTPAAAATNSLTHGCFLYFTCFESGTWTFAYDLAKHELATTGTFAWAS